jgi:hypothetical protein
MAEDEKGEGTEQAKGLRTIRRRRWYLWGLLLVYIPAIWISLEVTGSDRKTAYVFAVWFVLVFAAILAAAVVRCPRCGDPFHLSGVLPMFFRSCRHCGLDLRADRKK